MTPRADISAEHDAAEAAWHRLHSAIINAWALQKGAVAMTEQANYPAVRNDWFDALWTSIFAMDDVMTRVRQLADECDAALGREANAMRERGA